MLLIGFALQLFRRRRDSETATTSEVLKVYI